MHALKLYGPRTGRQNSYGAVRFLFKTACEQPGNSPYGARECDVTEALVGNKFVDHPDVVMQHCSNYIFILDLTPGFNGLGKDNFKTGREAFQFWDMVHLILEVWLYA